MISRLWRLGITCHGRPDIVFLPHDTPPLTRSHRPGSQRLTGAGYADRPSAEAIDVFASRAGGYRLDPQQSIDDNLARYCANVLASPATNCWLCRAPLFRFLSRHALRDAVCVIRHPLHQYGSFVKAQRHGDYAEAFGGPTSPGAVTYFASAWNAFVSDALAAGARVVRYEWARQEVHDDPFLRFLFAEHDGSRRNDGCLPPPMEQLLRERTADAFERVYPRWEL